MGKRIRLAIHINTESRNFGGLRIVPSLVLDFDKPSTICPLSQFLSLSLYIYTHTTLVSGFPDNSVGKESPCSAGDLGSIPGSGRSTGEGIGYPLRYSWASLVAQLVKSLPAVWRPGFNLWVGTRRRQSLSVVVCHTGLVALRPVGFSQTRNWISVSSPLQGRFLTTGPPGKPEVYVNHTYIE